MTIREESHGETKAIRAAQEAGPELKATHVAAVVAAATESHSPNTHRAYASAWKRFATWCEEEGYRSLPATPETTAAFLAYRADGGCSVATLKLARAAIRYEHESRGVDSPTQSPGVGRVLRGLARRATAAKAVPGRGQVKGLSATDLAAIVATAKHRRKYRNGSRESEERANWRGAVDVALVGTMRDALLRRSEALALTWADIEFADDGTALVTIRKSKTDQEGKGAVQFIGEYAASALKAIRPVGADADIASRPVFGLKSGRAIAKRIRAAAAAAGLQGRFGAHSCRIGMAQDLAGAGVSTTDLMVVGRWRAHRMPAHYTRAQAAAKGAVARYYRSR